MYITLQIAKESNKAKKKKKKRVEQQDPERKSAGYKVPLTL